eukprot:344476_1
MSGNNYVLLLILCHLFNNKILFANTINISFELSSFRLPTPLFKHISSTWNNSLHIIGGYTNNYTYPIASFMTYSTNTFISNQLANNTQQNITFYTNQSNIPDFWTAPTLEPTNHPLAPGDPFVPPVVGPSNPYCDYNIHRWEEKFFSIYDVVPACLL